LAAARARDALRDAALGAHPSVSPVCALRSDAALPGAVA
jgi:hypothetical protein